MSGLDQRGITLMEVVVSMLLLTIALVTLAASYPYAMYAVVAGGYQTTATLLAQQAIDDARAHTYDSLCDSTFQTGGTFVAVPGYDGFTRQITVAPLASPCPGNPSGSTTITVTVVVRFQGSGGSGGTIYDTTLATVFAQP
jgi:Tfp pilus assembly protein PilV